MTINTLDSSILEKICSYLQDVDLKAFEETSEKAQIVARNEIENRDKELERLLSPYEVARTFNATTVKDANLLLIGDEHGNEQYLSDRSALLYFLARRGPVVFIAEGKPSMQKIEDISEAGFCGNEEAFLIQSQSFNPTFKENIYSIGWDDQEELKRLDEATEEKYSEQQKYIEEAKTSLFTKLPDELLISESELTKLTESLSSLALDSLSSQHELTHLAFSIYLQKVRIKEIYFLQCLADAKKYFAYLDSTKQDPRIEYFKKNNDHFNLFNRYSIEELEELYKKELENAIIESEKDFGLISRDLIKHNKTIAILKKIIEVFELYDKAETLFSHQKTEQPNRLKLEMEIRITLLYIIFNWNLTEIGEKQPVNIPFIEIFDFSAFSKDLPISIVIKKLKLLRTHFLNDLPLEELKELLSYLEECNRITTNLNTLDLEESEDFATAVIKTFPIRTRSMADTLRKLDSYIVSLGLQQPTIVLLAGANHLLNTNKEPEYDLTTLYKELINHKAAILIPSGPSILESARTNKPTLISG